MKVAHPIAALVLFVALGIAAVWMQIEVVSAGYRVGALTQEQDVLAEDIRRLQIEIARADRPGELETQAVALQLDLLRPDGRPLALARTP